MQIHLSPPPKAATTHLRGLRPPTTTPSSTRHGDTRGPKLDFVRSLSLSLALGSVQPFSAGATKAPRYDFRLLCYPPTMSVWPTRLSSRYQSSACCLGRFRGYLRRDPQRFKGLRQAHQDILKGRSGESRKSTLSTHHFPCLPSLMALTDLLPGGYGVEIQPILQTRIRRSG